MGPCIPPSVSPSPQTLPAGPGKGAKNPREILLRAATQGLTCSFEDNLFPSSCCWPPACSVSWQRHRVVGAGLATGPVHLKSLGWVGSYPPEPGKPWGQPSLQSGTWGQGAAVTLWDRAHGALLGWRQPNYL